MTLIKYTFRSIYNDSCPFLKIKNHKGHTKHPDTPRITRTVAPIPRELIRYWLSRINIPGDGSRLYPFKQEIYCQDWIYLEVLWNPAAVGKLQYTYLRGDVETKLGEHYSMSVRREKRISPDISALTRSSSKWVTWIFFIHVLLYNPDLTYSASLFFYDMPYSQQNSLEFLHFYNFCCLKLNVCLTFKMRVLGIPTYKRVT